MAGINIRLPPAAPAVDELLRNSAGSNGERKPEPAVRATDLAGCRRVAVTELDNVMLPPIAAFRLPRHADLT